MNLVSLVAFQAVDGKLYREVVDFDVCPGAKQVKDATGSSASDKTRSFAMS
jgi:hypothetical protein